MLFPTIHSLFGKAEFIGASGLDLHKHQDSFVYGYNVYLSQRTTEIAFNYLVTIFNKKSCCYIFPLLSFRYTLYCHVGIRADFVIKIN